MVCLIARDIKIEKHSSNFSNMQIKKITQHMPTTEAHINHLVLLQTMILRAQKRTIHDIPLSVLYPTLTTSDSYILVQ